MKNRKLLMIPGPIEFTPEVLRAMGMPTGSHIAPNFIEVFGQALERMRDVWLCPGGQPFVIAGSGSLAMDIAAANLVEPGWFDLISIDKVKTPGLTLFMKLPGPISSIRAFDEMLDVIDRLEQLLPVTLKDKKRNKISKQMLMHMREEVVEFDRTKKLQRQ